MLSFRHWRLANIENGDSSNYTYISEMEYRASSGGADLTGSGTASASSTHSSGSLNGGFDDVSDTNTSSNWISNEADPPWYAYDFGSDTTVSHIAIEATRVSGRLGRVPISFDVEVSLDGISWEVQEAGFTTPNDWTAGEWREFALTTTMVDLQVLQVVTEALVSDAVDLQVSQVVVEALVANAGGGGGGGGGAGRIFYVVT